MNLFGEFSPLGGSRRDRGSDEKYSDINGRLSRKTGRPGHCHYIQVKSIQNLNFLSLNILKVKELYFLNSIVYN